MEFKKCEIGNMENLENVKGDNINKKRSIVYVCVCVWGGGGNGKTRKGKLMEKQISSPLWYIRYFL